jgi:hypothetical protein
MRRGPGVKGAGKGVCTGGAARFGGPKSAGSQRPGPAGAHAAREGRDHAGKRAARGRGRPTAAYGSPARAAGLPRTRRARAAGRPPMATAPRPRGRPARPRRADPVRGVPSGPARAAGAAPCGRRLGARGGHRSRPDRESGRGGTRAARADQRHAAPPGARMAAAAARGPRAGAGRALGAADRTIGAPCGSCIPDHPGPGVAASACCSGPAYDQRPTQRAARRLQLPGRLHRRTVLVCVGCPAGRTGAGAANCELGAPPPRACTPGGHLCRARPAARGRARRPAARLAPRRRAGGATPRPRPPRRRRPGATPARRDAAPRPPPPSAVARAALVKSPPGFFIGGPEGVVGCPVCRGGMR